MIRLPVATDEQEVLTDEQERLIAEVRCDEVPDVSHIPENERPVEADILRAQARAMQDIADALDPPAEVTDPRVLRKLDRELKDLRRQLEGGHETQQQDAAAIKSAQRDTFWTPWVREFEEELERQRESNEYDPVGTARRVIQIRIAEITGREPSDRTLERWLKVPAHLKKP